MNLRRVKTNTIVPASNCNSVFTICTYYIELFCLGIFNGICKKFLNNTKEKQFFLSVNAIGVPLICVSATMTPNLLNRSVSAIIA